VDRQGDSLLACFVGICLKGSSVTAIKQIICSAALVVAISQASYGLDVTAVTKSGRVKGTAAGVVSFKGISCRSHA
jgi:hypothetical protein